jgi:hypothetical protein
MSLRAEGEAIPQQLEILRQHAAQDDMFHVISA